VQLTSVYEAVRTVDVLTRSARRRVICAEFTFEPGISRDEADYRDNNPHHRHLHNPLSRWINDATHEGVISYHINVFVKRHRQSYRGAVNESIRRR